MKTPANTHFVETYQAKFKEHPFMGSVVGYSLINSIAAGIAKSGATDTAKMEEGFKGASFDTPFGQAMYRPIDHQGTLGTFVGKLALKNNKGTMTDWHYVDGASVMPPDDVVRKMRPAAS
jgi:branched-chain amino acid transport system substrate-binding protein